jgi:hypothetical protein
MEYTVVRCDGTLCKGLDGTNAWVKQFVATSATIKSDIMFIVVVSAILISFLTDDVSSCLFGAPFSQTIVTKTFPITVYE